MKTLKIKINKVKGGYKCVATNGDKPFDGRIHPTKKAAYNDLELAYPAHSTWQGKHIRGGFEIVID